MEIKINIFFPKNYSTMCSNLYVSLPHYHFLRRAKCIHAHFPEQKLNLSLSYFNSWLLINSLFYIQMLKKKLQEKNFQEELN